MKILKFNDVSKYKMIKFLKITKNLKNISFRCRYASFYYYLLFINCSYFECCVLTLQCITSKNNQINYKNLQQMLQDFKMCLTILGSFALKDYIYFLFQQWTFLLKANFHLLTMLSLTSIDISFLSKICTNFYSQNV